MAVTVAHYYTPNGTDISHRGIIPDVQVSLSEQERRTLSADQTLVGTQMDPHYEQALNALQPMIAEQQLRPSVQLTGQESANRSVNQANF